MFDFLFTSNFLRSGRLLNSSDFKLESHAFKLLPGQLAL